MKLFSLSVTALAAAAFLLPSGAQAQTLVSAAPQPLLIAVGPATIAQDNAASSVYSGGSYNGQNGGFGFGAFTVVSSPSTGGSFAGSFIGNATDSEDKSGGGVNSSGKAFGTYANGASTGAGNPVTTVTRNFNTGLTSGATFSLDFLTGYNDGGTAGVTLLTASPSSGSTFRANGLGAFAAGTSVGSFVYNHNETATGGGQGAFDFNGVNTGIGYANGLIHLEYDITSPTAYTLFSTGAVKFTGSGTYSGALSGFQFQQTNSVGGGADHDAFFNNLKETAGTPVSAAPEPSQLGVLLVVCLGGLALAARKRLVPA